MTSISSTLCSITIDEEDLKKLEDLDPNQSNGFKSILKMSVPMKIVYINELGDEFTDIQDITIQILVLVGKGSAMQRHSSVLEQVQLYLTSESDLYLNFISNCTKETFTSICGKNGLNIEFNDFPNALINMLRNCTPSPQSTNEIELSLSYEGTGKMRIFQQTQYKKLELVELFFVRSTVEKTHQSIIYRYNFQKSKLALIDKSIESIYDILAQKNAPLLQYIQSTIGVNE